MCAMTQVAAWIGAIVLFSFELQTPAVTGPTQPKRPAPRTAAQVAGAQAFFTGSVVEIYAPRLFEIREADESGRQLLVLAPRELSTVKGATVAVSGTVQRFGSRDLGRVRGWSDLDERLRARFAGRPVLVATAVMSTLAPEGSEPTQAAEAETPPAQPEPASTALPAEAAPLPLRAAMVVDFIDTFAGQEVRIQNARVVGLITPTVFLVEPATPYLKPMGARDRLAVFIGAAHLRVGPEVLVGSIVRLEGAVRTLLSLRASHEIDWPASLDTQRIDRLEIRAAIVASSVRTAEGTELTER
jgi:hypothetical protein